MPCVKACAIFAFIRTALVPVLAADSVIVFVPKIFADRHDAWIVH